VLQDKRLNIRGPSFHGRQPGSVQHRSRLADTASLVEVEDHYSSLVVGALRSRLAEGSRRRSFAEGIEDRPGSILGSTL